MSRLSIGAVGFALDVLGISLHSPSIRSRRRVASIYVNAITC